jgi:hypothetical protein
MNEFAGVRRTGPRWFLNENEWGISLRAALVASSTDAFEIVALGQLANVRTCDVLPPVAPTEPAIDPAITNPMMNGI